MTSLILSKETECYKIFEPQASSRCPLLISIPHCGQQVPPDCRPGMRAEYWDQCPDSDHRMDAVFDYATELGATLVVAKFSRFTVDLNRDPSGAALYSDGRTITEVVPTKTFSDERIYEIGKQPDASEQARRIALYFNPYHALLEQKLSELLSRFKKVILYDAHSIERVVPKLASHPLPDLMLGTNARASADPALIDKALELLAASGFTFAHNAPFSGGFITRHFGKPERGIHALQMERSQDIYLKVMSGSAKTSATLDYEKVEAMKKFEKKLLENLLLEI